MRAVIGALIGSVVGWFGGLGLIALIALVAGMSWERPFIARGMELVGWLAGLVGGTVFGQRRDRAAWSRQLAAQAQPAAAQPVAQPVAL
jgi:TctA family transporter